MRHLIIGTAGHVDHGKTALIKALTNIDCDTHKEEKERGITINLGFSHILLPSGDSLGIIDVPGHKDFIKTMVAGAFGIDLVLLVIAADSGIMPQTKEHLNIIETLGVKKGIIVLNKADLVDEEMMEMAELEVIEYLEGSVFESAPIVAVSSRTKQGLDILVTEIEKLAAQSDDRPKNEVFRMYIDRIFTVSGLGCVVTGSVLGGNLQSGSTLYLGPDLNKQLKVRSIERHGETVNEVSGGDRAALNLTGLKTEEYSRGMILSNKILESTQMIDVQFNMFTDDQILGRWSSIIFYSGTFECMAKMHLLDKDQLVLGETAFVQLHLDKSACLMTNDKFIVRNSSNTLSLGGGVILDTKPLHHRKRTPKLISSLQNLANAILYSEHLFGLINYEVQKKAQPIFVCELSESLGQPSELILDEIQKFNKGSIQLFNNADRSIAINNDLHSKYRNQIIEILQQHHKKIYLLEEGLALKDFHGKIDIREKELAKLYMEALIDQMLNDGLLKEAGQSIALKSHEVKLDKKSLVQLDWLENEIKNYGRHTPLLSEIEKLALSKNISKDQLKMRLQYLVKIGKLYFSEGEYIHEEHVRVVKQILLSELINRDQGINEKDTRLLIDSSKNFLKAITRIFLSLGYVNQETYYINITEEGKKQIT
ncbi:MAG: selenocysteine-specific translation elongation factor [Bacteroidetes bacterium]|nr:selenocysteine-specific translation elongation factor [Bacteroidota bacterium]